MQVIPEPDARQWYQSCQEAYGSFHQKAADIIRELLLQRKVPFHEVSSRLKTADSLIAKIEQKRYTSYEEITDLAGVRVTVFIASDKERAKGIIKECFNIDWSNSSENPQELTWNEFGYRSIHYVASLNPQRLALPEYQQFEGCKLEIQLRTILEHAWAEIEHDRNYKGEKALPERIRRKFARISAQLEFLDEQFDELAYEIDEYVEIVAKKTASGDLQIPLDSTSLTAYLDTRFGDFPTYVRAEKTGAHLDSLIQHCIARGINTLEQFAALIDNRVMDMLDAKKLISAHLILWYVLIIQDAHAFLTFPDGKPWNYVMYLEDLASLDSLGIHIDVSQYPNLTVRDPAKTE